MKRKVSSVTKKVQVLVVATILAGSSVHAIADVGQEEKPLWSSQDKGTGFGALLGAIAGGPPGLILGAFGGSLIGRHEGMQEQLAQSQQELVLVKQQLAQLQQQARLQAQKAEAMQEDDRHTLGTTVMVASAQPVAIALPIDPLSVIEQGFSMTIHFRTGSHQLEHHYQEQLAKLSRQLLNLDAVLVHLDGYSDDRGDEGINMSLSQQRIETIDSYLQKNGIAADLITRHAHGEQLKLVADSDREALLYDRRVVISFSKKP